MQTQNGKYHLDITVLEIERNRIQMERAWEEARRKVKPRQSSGKSESRVKRHS